MGLVVPATFDSGFVFEVWSTAVVGLVIAIVVVVMLIFSITRNALQIDLYLDGVIETAQRILDNTTPLFALEQTVKLADELRSTVSSIEDDAKTVLSRAGASSGRYEP